MRLARWLSAAALSTAAALVLLSFAGGLHPLGDSLAAFRPWLALVTLAFALLALLAGLSWSALAGTAVAVLAVSAPMNAMLDAPRVGGEDAIRIYQKNLRLGRVQPDELVADIVASGADFVTLQEVKGGGEAVLDRLAATHPVQLACSYRGVGQVAVASRWPASEELCVERKGLVGLRVATPDGPVWLVSVHLPWPWPFAQARRVRTLLPELAALDGPVILGGDFNMAPWSWAVAALAEATGTDRGLPVRATFDLLGWIGLPIDHVLTPAGWRARAQTRPKLGSDHRGLLVTAAPGAP